MMTDQLENELRGAFARNAADPVAPQAVHTRLVQRDYHPRTANRGHLAGLATAATAAAAGITSPLALTATQAPAAGAAIRMASHTFRLPSGYRLTAAASAPCHPFAVYLGPPAHTTDSSMRSMLGAGMRAAVSSAGGCIVFTVAPRYIPKPGAPDPEAYTEHPVQVGKYHGYIFHMSMDVSQGSAGQRLTPGWHHATNLWVQLPAGNGQLRDLVVGATGLSDQSLIDLVAKGLSA